jgi:hypothetical protein
MFWNKKNEGTTEITKLNANILLIMQSAKIVMTSETLKKRAEKVAWWRSTRSYDIASWNGTVLYIL